MIFNSQVTIHQKNERMSTMNKWVFYAFQQVNKKLFKRFPWYDVFISYILKFTLWSRLTDCNTLLIQSEAQTIVLHSINVSMCEMKFTLWWAYLWKDHKVSILSFCIWVVTVGYWHSLLIVNTKKGVKIPSQMRNTFLSSTSWTFEEGLFQALGGWKKAGMCILVEVSFYYCIPWQLPSAFQLIQCSF